MILKINYDHKPDVVVELTSSLEGVWVNIAYAFESDDPFFLPKGFLR